MATHHLSPAQFAPPGDEQAKADLKQQLGEGFPEGAISWLDDPSIRVDAATRIDASRIDFDDYPDWRASRQLKAVRKIAKKIDKGKVKPAVFADCGGQELDTIDGHHHVLGAIDAKKKPKGFVVHVPSQTGPWTEMHDQQTGDSKKDDFGKTAKSAERREL